MPILPRLVGALKSMAGRAPADTRLDAEVAGYFEMVVDEQSAAGMDAGEARRRARLQMGGVEQVKEDVRAVRPAAWFDTTVRDVRYGLRQLARTPAFSSTAIVVLALGIGANAAVFTAVDVLCFRPLPGAAQPGQAVGIYARGTDKPDAYRSFSYAEYEAVRGREGVFDDVAAHASTRVGLNEGDWSRRAKAMLTTSGYFATLGVRLAAGRTFSPDEERPGSGAAVMVLSHSYWERLGSPRDILGRTIFVNSRPFTVVGVAPSGFAGQMALAGPAFWMPLGAQALFSGSTAEGPPAAQRLVLIGRLKPGVTVEAANGALASLSEALDAAPDGTRYRPTVARLSRYNQNNRPADDGDAGLFVALGTLEGAALILLIIASLNVANMQLARGANRRKEMAMRLALGAGRGRIVRQLMTEALILAAAGGLLGILAGSWVLHPVLASFASVIPDAITADLSLDWRILLASLAFCTLSAVAFGLGPAWKLSRLDLLPEMKCQEGGGAGARLRALGTRNLLVAGQVALSLALLAASGLFVRGAIAAGAAEPGYLFDRQLLVRLDPAAGGLDEWSGRQASDRILERIRALPGVESAAIASYVAFANDSFTRRAWRPGTLPGDGPRAGGGVTALSFDVGAEYFKTLGLPMLRGREFTPGEAADPGSTDIAIVDEPLASALFPGEDPVGQFVQFTGEKSEEGRPVRIVGVAPGVRHRLADAGPVAHIYLPLGSHYRPLLNIHVRTAAGGPRDVRAAVRDAVRSAEPRMSILAVQSLAEARDSMPVNWIVRTAARTFGAFGAIALFMAAIGLYGVKAYLVARRTREIGIRMAVGAGGADVIRMVLKDGAALLVGSIAVGFLLAVGVGQAVSSLLVGVKPFDPIVMLVATLVLSVAVLAACYLPARRATRISPITALRVE